MNFDAHTITLLYLPLPEKGKKKRPTQLHHNDHILPYLSNGERLAVLHKYVATEGASTTFDFLKYIFGNNTVFCVLFCFCFQGKSDRARG